VQLRTVNYQLHVLHKEYYFSFGLNQAWDITIRDIEVYQERTTHL